VITAPAGGATAIFGSDLARVLDDDTTMRVLPVLGKGPVRNVVDTLYLKSIDMGAVAADVIVGAVRVISPRGEAHH